MTVDARTILEGLDVVDLSVVVDPAYPVVGLSSPRIQADVLSRTEDDGWYTRWIALEEHSGTHFDAPCHVIPPLGSTSDIASELGSVTSDLVSLAELVRPAAVIDCRSLLNQASIGRSPIISAALIQEWENDHGAFRGDEAVLFYTSFNDLHYLSEEDGGRMYYASRHTPPETVGWPAPNVETIDYLASRGVRLIAIDAAAMGPTEGSYSEHVAGLGAGVLFVEKLCGLGQLPARGALFAFLPVKLKGGSGAFGRAMALVPRSAERLGA